MIVSQSPGTGVPAGPIRFLINRIYFIFKSQLFSPAFIEHIRPTIVSQSPGQESRRGLFAFL